MEHYKHGIETRKSVSDTVAQPQMSLLSRVFDVCIRNRVRVSARRMTPNAEVLAQGISYHVGFVSLTEERSHNEALRSTRNGSFWLRYSLLRPSFPALLLRRAAYTTLTAAVGAAPVFFPVIGWLVLIFFCAE